MSAVADISQVVRGNRFRVGVEPGLCVLAGLLVVAGLPLMGIMFLGAACGLSLSGSV